MPNIGKRIALSDFWASFQISKKINDRARIVCGASGQTAQPVPLASLKLSMAVHGQKQDGRPSS